LVVDSEIVSVCNRVISAVAGPDSSETLPGSSVALDTVTSNDNSVTPTGGVSVISKAIGVPVGGTPPPNDPVAWPLLQPAKTTASARSKNQLGFNLRISPCLSS
jgi:hypothetical protein